MRLLYTMLLCGCHFILAAQTKPSYAIYFDHDKASPSAGSREELTKLIKEFQQLPVASILIKGFTDKSGDEQYNVRLSQRRAEGIAAILKQSLPDNVPIKVEYYGEDGQLFDEDREQYLNRRVQLFISYNEPKREDIRVEGFFEDVPEQEFAIDLSDTVMISGQGGTSIKIPPGSIQAKNGTTATGKAKLLLKEYYEPGDILLAGMHTSSKEGLLQTGGMFKLFIVQGQDTMDTKTKKNVEIQMLVRNKNLTNMNIFTMDHRRADSSRWQNTGVRFNIDWGYWDWPRMEKLMGAVTGSDVRMEYWRIGSSYARISPVGPWLCIGCGNKYPVKEYSLRFHKVGKDSLRVYVEGRYRKRGKEKFGQEKLDTSYLVQYRRATYKGEVGNLSFINCDRFYNNPNVTDFYVTTPGFKGMNVLAYFKRLNAFMISDAGPEDFRLSRVPENEEVYIVAFGKKDGTYYASIHPYTVAKNGKVSVSFAQMDEDSFKKEIKSIGR